MKKLLFLPLVLFSSSVFAVSDPSANGTFYYVNFSLTGVTGVTSVHTSSCNDALIRMNLAMLNANPSLSEEYLFKKLLAVRSASTNDTVWNCNVTRGSQTGVGSSYTAVQITKNFGGSQPDLSSVAPSSMHHLDVCPSFYPLIVDNPSIIPDKMCAKSSPNGTSTKFCGLQSPLVADSQSGAQVLYSLYKTFDSDAECGSWKNGTDLITPETKATLDALIERSRDLFADESYTEESRNNLFDVTDSIVSDYPLTETQAKSDISRLEQAISDLKKVDGTDPEPPDPEPTDPDMSGVIDAINKMSDRLSSSLDSLTNTVRTSINDLSSTIVSSLSDLASSIDSSLNTNFSALFDKIDSSVDSTNLAIAEVNSSVLSNGDKLDVINDSILSSSDTLKTSIDDLKTSNSDGFSDVVSAINNKDLSVDVGDVNVSLDDSNIVSELRSISSKLDDLFSDEGSADYEALGTPTDDSRFLSAQSDASTKLATVASMLGFSSAPPPDDFVVSTGIYGDVTIELSVWHPLMYIFKLFFHLTVLFYCYKMLSRTVENY